MGFLKKILGICNTKRPENNACWDYFEGKVEILLDHAKELSEKNNAIRLEGKGLPCRLLVFLGEDGQYHTITNKCSHMGGRRIDPVPGSETLMCCSIGGSTYAYNGEVLNGPAGKSLKTFPVELKGRSLIVPLTYL